MLQNDNRSGIYIIKWISEEKPDQTENRDIFLEFLSICPIGKYSL